MTLLKMKKHLSLSENTEIETIWRKITNNNYYRILLGAIVGAGLGLLYWKFIGCNSGTCPLTSDPYKTVGIFTLMGGLYAKKDKQKKKEAN